MRIEAMASNRPVLLATEAVRRGREALPPPASAAAGD